MKSASTSAINNYTTPSSKWSVLVVSLPASDYLKQVVIKVTRSPYGQSGIIIDDFNVRPCSDLDRKCLLTALGREYMGSVNVGKSGQKCEY